MTRSHRPYFLKLRVISSCLMALWLGLASLAAQTAPYNWSSPEDFYTQAAAQSIPEETWKNLEARGLLMEAVAALFEGKISTKIRTALTNLEDSKIHLPPWTRSRLSCLVAASQLRTMLADLPMDFKVEETFRRVNEAMHQYVDQELAPITDRPRKYNRDKKAWDSYAAELAETRNSMKMGFNLIELRIDMYRIIRQTRYYEQADPETFSPRVRAILARDQSFASDMNLYDLLMDEWQLRVLRRNDRGNRNPQHSTLEDVKDFAKDLQTVLATIEYPIAPSDRRMKTQQLLAVVHAAEQAQAPDYDETDVPELNIAPPPETGLSAGVDPAAITDIKLRKVYEEKIAENTKKVEYHHQQQTLRRFIQGAQAQVLGFMYSAYDGHKKFDSGWNVQHREELLRLSEEADVSQEFRDELEQRFK